MRNACTPWPRQGSCSFLGQKRERGSSQGRDITSAWQSCSIEIPRNGCGLCENCNATLCADTGFLELCWKEVPGCASGVSADGPSFTGLPEGQLVRSLSFLTPGTLFVPTDHHLPRLHPAGVTLTGKAPVASDQNGSLFSLSVKEALPPNSCPTFRVYAASPSC